MRQICFSSGYDDLFHLIGVMRFDVSFVDMEDKVSASMGTYRSDVESGETLLAALRLMFIGAPSYLC